MVNNGNGGSAVGGGGAPSLLQLYGGQRRRGGAGMGCGGGVGIERPNEQSATACVGLCLFSVRPSGPVKARTGPTFSRA